MISVIFEEFWDKFEVYIIYVHTASNILKNKQHEIIPFLSYSFKSIPFCYFVETGFASLKIYTAYEIFCKGLMLIYIYI